MIFLQNMAFFTQNALLCGVLEPTFHGHMRDVGFLEDVSDGVESEFLVERDSLCLSMKTQFGGALGFGIFLHLRHEVLGEVLAAFDG